jgi:hypothetical protein
VAGGDVTKRKPLAWYDTGHNYGIDGNVPACDECSALLLSVGFIDAVYSVGIEHPGDPADLAKRVIDDYHARRHPADEWRAAGR